MAGPRTQPAPAPIGSETFAAASRLLHTAALARAIDEPGRLDRLTPLLQGRFALRSHTVDVAVDTAVREAAHNLLTHGWTPAEVHTFAARRLDPPAIGYLIDALAATAQWSASPVWLADLAQLRARVWWTVGEPHFGQWATRHDQRRAESLRVAVDVLALLSYLPRTDAALPDTPTALTVPAGALVQDRRIVGKIDALLARASSSTFPDEAAACANKAQELMVRYATIPPPAPPGPDTATATAAVAAALKRLTTRRRPSPTPLWGRG